MKKVLVTGGNGYIGSHTVVDLSEQGFSPVSVDNHSNSYPFMWKRIQEAAGRPLNNHAVDLCDLEALRAVFRAEPGIDSIIHFAAFIFVNESVEQPLRYFHNNLNGLINILQCMTEFGVKNLIFSSSCSVYGNATELPVREQTPLSPPQSPYARTKVMGEEIIRDYIAAQPGKNAILLRYFNPAGCHASGLIGEAPKQEHSRLTPILAEVATGRRPHITVFGDDYATRDGSCIRDYIHVSDIAHAHSLALQYLLEGRHEANVEVFNIGIGEGVTVFEAIAAFEKATGQKLPTVVGPRRAGDVEAVYADNSRTRQRLGWTPRHGIEDIMRTAWLWEEKRLRVVAEENI